MSRANIVVKVPPELYDALYQHAQAEGSSISKFTREAIREKLNRQTKDQKSAA